MHANMDIHAYTHAYLVIGDRAKRLSALVAHHVVLAVVNQSLVMVYE
jgi:hypothetical protein